MICDVFVEIPRQLCLADYNALLFTFYKRDGFFIVNNTYKKYLKFTKNQIHQHIKNFNAMQILF